MSVVTGRCRRVILLGCAAWLSGGCAAGAPVAALTGGDSGRISFQSLTFPATQLLTLSQEGTASVVWGDLRIPGDRTRRLPAVILLHGAGGVSPNLADWAYRFDRLGIASFVVDSFSPRAIVETRTGQARISMSSRIVDAYRALELLATHPRLDLARIALMGFSQGGGVVLLARHARFQQLWMSGVRQFAAFLAFYPTACNATLLGEDRVKGGPLRIFHGTADDKTIIGPCRELVERLRKTGQDVSLIEYPYAHHGFDIRTLPPSHYDAPVISSRNCVYVERAPAVFEVTSRDTGQPTRANDCLSRGITLGYNAQAHEQAIQDVKNFLDATLATGR